MVAGFLGRFFLPVNILTVWSLAFLAARHTTVCLDIYMYMYMQNTYLISNLIEIHFILGAQSIVDESSGMIKTHGSVSCGPRSRRATREYINRRKKTQFSHLCSSVIPYPIGTKFAREVPASKGGMHTKFEENRSSHFRDISEQNFILISSFFFLLHFAHFAKSTIKHECMLGSG